MEELENIKKWFNLNELSVNVDKTQCILFHGYMKDMKLSVKLDSKVITQTNTLKLFRNYIGF